MTRRMWRWAGAIAVLAALDLGFTIHAHAAWHRPPGSQQSTTLGQVVGFATAGGLVVIVVLILWSGWRSWRVERRLRLLAARSGRRMR